MWFILNHIKLYFAEPRRNETFDRKFPTAIAVDAWFSADSQGSSVVAKTFPGFMMPLGSRIFLMLLMILSFSGEV